MIKIFSIAAICALLYSCESTQKNASDFKNMETQTINVGDEVKIYYTTNSCCSYCSPDKEKLNHLEYVGDEIIIPYPDDCDGCSRTKALVFKAKSSGTDTIFGRIYTRSEDCNDSLSDFDSFVIHVR